jgi:hypothetical protein
MSRSWVPFAVCLALLVGMGQSQETDSNKGKSLTVTKEERRTLMGLTARLELVKLQAQREMDEIGAEQKEVLEQIAKRLGMTFETLVNQYVINLSDSTVQKKEQEAEKVQETSKKPEGTAPIKNKEEVKSPTKSSVKHSR